VEKAGPSLALRVTDLRAVSLLSLLAFARKIKYHQVRKLRL